MRTIFLLIIILTLTAPNSGTAANVLVTDVSKDHISIRTDFSGESLLLFGAIDTSLHGPVDGVIVSLRGPDENVILRKKQKQFGIWVNGASYKMGPLPSFYAIVSSKELAKLMPFNEQKKRGIGAESLTANLLSDTPDLVAKNEALSAFIRLKQNEGLFAARTDKVEIINEKLFRAEINLPAGMPVGRYIMEFFAYKNGTLIGYQTGDLPVDIVGAGHILHQAAYEMSLLYGLLGVLMAILMGWSVAVLFRRQ